MDITSKSLHHANIVFVFEEKKFVLPDNTALMGVYQGDLAAGAQFVDDPVLKTKILDLPRLKTQIAIDLNRLRVEDFSQTEPENSNLINTALYVHQQLFNQIPLAGLGFNFDIYYRSSEVIRLEDLFKKLVDAKALEKKDLRDVGIQFTLEKEGGKKRETYFLKIIAPLEIVLHINHHFSLKKLPEKDELTAIFENCYKETDEVIKNLKIS